MDTYNEQLSDAERAAIEAALDTLKDELAEHGIKLNMSDPSAHAAEALAKYIVESRK